MKRLSEVRREMVIEGAGPPTCRCLFCNTPTDWQTLSDHGARCFSCYQAYKRAVPKLPYVGEKTSDPRGWAYALKRREESGEKLTQFQKQSWREVVQ